MNYLISFFRTITMQEKKKKRQIRKGKDFLVILWITLVSNFQQVLLFRLHLVVVRILQGLIVVVVAV